MNLSHGMADLVSYGNADRDIEQVIHKCGFMLFEYKVIFLEKE